MIVVTVACDPLYFRARGDEHDLAAHKRDVIGPIALSETLSEVLLLECALELLEDPVGRHDCEASIDEPGTKQVRERAT